jgi:hypothetical protein
VTPQELLAAGWTRRGLIWHPPAALPDPPADELEPYSTVDTRLLRPCGTKAARDRHRLAGVRCIRCEAISETKKTRPGRGNKRRTA